MAVVVQSLVRWLVATVAVWVGSVLLHVAVEGVPELPILGAAATVIMVRGLMYGVSDLIKKED